MKGQATAVTQMLAGLFVVGLIIALILIFLSKFLNIQTAVLSNEVERHAINSGNVLLSSKELVVSDEYKPYRAVFSKSKLDEYLITRKKYESLRDAGLEKLVEEIVLFQEKIENLIEEGKIKEMAYPNSIVFGVIVDLEDPNKENEWLIISRGPINIEGFSLYQTFECLLKDINIDWDMFFRPSPAGLVRWPSLAKCGINFISEAGVSSQGFPVGIKVSKDEIHVGRMYIWLLEI
ncbi:MAG: hypothetical protein QW609_02225 [Candidatus Aenigmatarchaeota archaeon]